GKLADFAPDVVLTDLKMPGMDGIELLRKLRGQEDEPVVVVMTAFGGVDTAVAAMKEGAADYLTKPINMTELSLVLRREMDRRGRCGRACPSGTASTTSSATRRRSRTCSRRWRRWPRRRPASSSPASRGPARS